MASKSMILALVTALCFGGALGTDLDAHVNTYGELVLAAKSPKVKDIFITGDIVFPKKSEPILLGKHVKVHG